MNENISPLPWRINESEHDWDLSKSESKDGETTTSISICDAYGEVIAFAAVSWMDKNFEYGFRHPVLSKRLEANAPLIAAAPELLESCKSLLTLTQLMANEAYNDEAIVEFEIFSEKTKSTRCLVLVFELAKARAAIAKATGRADSGQAAQGDRHE